MNDNSRTCCYFNKMIDCEKKDKCNHCGWNPDVAAERIEKWSEGRHNDSKGDI